MTGCTPLCRNYLDQRPESLIDRIGSGEVLSHVRFQHDRTVFKLKVLNRVGAIFFVNDDLMALAVCFVVLASDATLHGRKVVFRSHVFSSCWLFGLSLLHSLSFHALMPCAH